MKKIAAFLLIAALTAALCACGSNSQKPDGSSADSGIPGIIDVLPEGGGELSPEDVKNNYDKAFAYVESTIDTTGMTANPDDEQEGYYYCYWFYDEEAENVTFPMDVDVDGARIVVGETLEKDLKGLGFETEVPSETAEPDESIGVVINKNGKSAALTLQNNETGQPVPVADLPVFVFTDTDSEYSIPFTYAGLSSQSTIADVIKVLGKPNSSIHLSSDDISTTIELSYANNVTENDSDIMDSLDLTFIYNAESNTAALSNINLSRSISPREEMAD